MALDFQKQQIVFQGLSEHTNPKTQIPGALRRCENAVFPKAGRIDKRRGYRLVNVQREADGDAIDPQNLMCNVTTYRGQLVIVGYDSLFSLAGLGDEVGDGDLVRRGPTLRGNVHVRVITAAPHTSERP